MQIEVLERRRAEKFWTTLGGTRVKVGIDHVILSHPHRDHVELLQDLLAAYEVRQVWDAGG